MEQPVATTVTHLSDEAGRDHLVAVSSLRVLVMPCRDGWYAQGLEIDYGAQGSTPEEARAHFAVGFQDTMRLNLQRHGNVDRLLKSAPRHFWSALANHADSRQLSCAVLVQLAEPAVPPAFRALRFIESSHAGVAATA